MLGIIGGTSFQDTEILGQGKVQRIITPYGGCDVHINDDTLFIARHGFGKQIPPHRINHHAQIAAMKQAGVTHIAAFGSVGSLRETLMPGSILVPSDFFAPFRVVTCHEEEQRFIVPGFQEEWRWNVINYLVKAELQPIDQGVYVETLGPRFETLAEVRFLAQWGDVVGMTCASELTLASEMGIPLTIINIIDNYANGITRTQLTGERFQLQVAMNLEKAVRALEAIINGFRVGKKSE